MKVGTLLVLLRSFLSDLGGQHNSTSSVYRVYPEQFQVAGFPL